MSVDEPDWEQFRKAESSFLDHELANISEFIAAFIDWRKRVNEEEET